LTQPAVDIANSDIAISDIAAKYWLLQPKMHGILFVSIRFVKCLVHSKAPDNKNANE